MIMTIDIDKIEPYITIPRYIVDDVRDGKITYREYELYVWIRLQANPYGISTTSTESIRSDLQHFKSTDWVSKTLRSLRSKKYLHYKERQGHRGSFRINFGDWILKGGKIKQIKHLFDGEELRSENGETTEKSSEVGLDNASATPKSDEPKPETKSVNEEDKSNFGVRSPHTDTETQKDIETQRIVGNQKTFKGVATRYYFPKSDDERRCKEIATEVEDPCMDFILKMLREHGIETINDAKIMYDQIRTENEHNGKPTKNPPALFNWCVQQTVNINKTLEEERKTYGDDSIGRE
jgi:hypothetical protein